MYLKKMGKSGDQLDMERSRCPNLYKIVMKKAAESKPRSPCSNVPMRCPLCLDPGLPAVWKYNFVPHFAEFHPSANIELYMQKWALTDAEEAGMQAVFLNRKTVRVSQKMKKRAQAPTLQISDAHSTRLALRSLYIPFKRLPPLTSSASVNPATMILTGPMSKTWPMCLKRTRVSMTVDMARWTW